MNIKTYFTDFLTIFATTLIVAAVVTFLYSLIAHGAGAIDWETSFDLAIRFGIILPWVETRNKNRKNQVAS